MSEDTMLRCIVSGPDAGKLTHVPPIVANDRTVSFTLDQEISLPDWAVEVLRNSAGYDVTVLDEDETVSPPVTGDGDSTTTAPGGGGGGAETFNADAVIEGNLDQVRAKLAGLTAEQLDLVLAAEADREVSRKGVETMVLEAKEALAGGA